MTVFTKPSEKIPVPPSNFRIPERIEQVKIFIQRNITRKIADKQYMVINLLEAPLLAVILGYISKFTENGLYTFEQNKNYTVFLFMSIVVALFMGLTVSAEEIFRDRKLLEREKFLNLSRLSYLVSKISFLFALSAIQTLSFVVVTNLILNVRGMLLQQWIILFSTACFGNILGLNVSAGMRTAVSIYILIPLILVPQLLLGGAMIKFDDLHTSITKKIYVPVVGDIMVTRWAHEALCVEQFRRNRFEKPFFKYDMEISQNDWYAAFLLPNLRVVSDELVKAGKNENRLDYLHDNFSKLNYHIDEMSEYSGVTPGSWMTRLNAVDYNEYTSGEVKKYLDSLKTVFRLRSRDMTLKKDSLYNLISSKMGNDRFIELRSKNYNENLADIVLNRMGTNKIYDAGDRLIQKADPVFMKPGSKYGRAHFFAPYKQLGNLRIDTLLFNIIAIWFMSFVLFITLYYNLLKRFIRFLESLNIPILKKFGREFLPF